jgi:hypothetical protein
MTENLRVGEAQIIRLCRSIGFNTASMGDSTAGDSTAGARSIG